MTYRSAGVAMLDSYRHPDPPKEPEVKLRLSGVGKDFVSHGQVAQRALVPLNLDVYDGEFLCIVGPSGCGKTTLLRILAGLETATSGTVEVCQNQGDRTGGRKAHARPGNSMVFQDQSLFPWMSVRDNVAFGLKARGFSRAERYRMVQPFIDKVHLSGFENALPHQLSGGMKQRVSIARAFANDPEILLMDEPFSALDEQTKIVLQGELIRIWEEDRKTVCYVTHSIDEAIVLADRILIMTARPGRIKEMIDLAPIFGRPRDVETVKSSAEYGKVFARVWGALRDEVAGAAAEGGKS